MPHAGAKKVRQEKKKGSKKNSDDNRWQEAKKNLMEARQEAGEVVINPEAIKKIKQRDSPYGCRDKRLIKCRMAEYNQKISLGLWPCKEKVGM